MKAPLSSLLAGGLALSAWLSAAEPAPATHEALPSIESVLERYITALGGRAALEPITSRLVKGAAELPLAPGASTWELATKAPNLRLSILTIPNFGEVMEGFNGTLAWVKNPTMPLTERTGEELAKARRDAEFNRELRLLKIYPDLAVKKLEKLGDEEAYVVESKPSPTSVERFYFARQSGRLLRQDSEFDAAEGPVRASLLYEDYVKVDGIWLPHRLRITAAGAMGELQFTLRFQEVKHNVAIDDARFAKPKE